MAVARKMAVAGDGGWAAREGRLRRGERGVKLAKMRL